MPPPSSDEHEHKLDLLRHLQHLADGARRWQAKRDRAIQMFYAQKTASLSELASAAGISKARAHQIIKGPCRNPGPLNHPAHRVQLPRKMTEAELERPTQAEIDRMNAALEKIVRSRRSTPR